MLDTQVLEVLLRTEEAAFVSDGEGRVRHCNPPAARLLGVRPSAIVGSHCWQVLGMRGLDGSRFCSSRCPIQARSGRQTLSGRHRVRRADGRGGFLELDLVTLPLAGASKERRPVLHVLLPVRPVRQPRGVAQVLTRREREILHLLAQGRSTDRIGAELFISPVTVRNHTHRILTKLGVHTRLEAVLAFLASSGDGQ